MIINQNLSFEQPVVSISMLTYNHEKYIEKAIKSVLMQKTDFKYHLIIGEDCSTDNTRAIVERYAYEYPDRIIAILNDSNLGIKRNVLEVRNFLNGKYIAILEGDDYWTDKDKLKKQVDFLEHNKKYWGVSCKHIDVDENENLIKYFRALEMNSGYTKEALYDLQEFGKYYLAEHSGTLLYRNFFDVLTSEQVRIYDECDIIGDRKLNLILAYLGGVYRLNDTMSAYRHHQKAWTNKKLIGGLAYYGYQNIFKLRELAYQLFHIEIDFDEGELRSWYGTCIAFLKSPNADTFLAVKNIFDDGNKGKKLLFLITHTILALKRIYKNR